MSGERVVLFDLDGTLTRRDTYLAYLIGYLLRHPARLVHAPALAVAVLLYVCRRRDNTWLKITFLRLILGGEELGALEAWTRVFLDRVLTRGMRARALETMAEHRAAGARLVLVTASLDFYARPLGVRLGFDEILCTRAAVDAEGRLTGALDGENCYGPSKRRCVEAYLMEHAPGRPVGLYTDHHADLPLLRFVESPVAVNPTRRLRRAARAIGIPVQRWT
jgi:phosphatidylglycerophosphatase C